MADEFEIRFPGDERRSQPAVSGQRRGRGETDESEELELRSPDGKSLVEWRREIEAELKSQLGGESESPPVENWSAQFTLKELMQLVLCCGVAFAVLRMVPTDLFAGALGLTTFASLAVLTIAKPQKMFFYMAWWALLAVYVISSVIAIVGKR
jgi:hypothetical protein